MVEKREEGRIYWVIKQIFVTCAKRRRESINTVKGIGFERVGKLNYKKGRQKRMSGYHREGE